MICVECCHLQSLLLYPQESGADLQQASLLKYCAEYCAYVLTPEVKPGGLEHEVETGAYRFRERLLLETQWDYASSASAGFVQSQRFGGSGQGGLDNIPTDRLAARHVLLH